MKKRILKQWHLLLAFLLTSALSTAVMVAQAMYMSWLLDHAVENNTGIFGKMILIGLCVMVSYLVIYSINAVTEKTVKNKILEKIRERLFCDIYSQSMTDYGRVSTAEYISQMTNDMMIVENSYLESFIGIMSAVLPILASLILFLYYAPIVLLVIIISIVAIIFIPSLMGSILQKKQQDYSEQSVIFTNRIKDYFSGFEVIASADRKEEAKQEFIAENKSFTKGKLSAEAWMEVSGTVSQILAMSMQVAAMIACVWFIMQGQMTIGNMMMLIQIMNFFVYPITAILQAVPQMKGAKPVIDKLDGYIQETKERGAVDFKNSISLTDISFAYGEGETVLKDISLSVEKGKKYAVIGASGCGKSTLFKVISGYFDNYNGEITVDGNVVDCRTSDKLNSLCAFIHQNIFLFDKTIRENICMYREYSDEELKEVLKKSGVSKFLDEELTLDSAIGENGSKISGGQKQRIAIARAMIQKKPVILLDEGTSALDPQTAYEIENDLLNNPNITLLTITHHFQNELLQKYDAIVFMQDGRVVEAAPYDTLLQTSEAANEFIRQAEDNLGALNE